MSNKQKRSSRDWALKSGPRFWKMSLLNAFCELLSVKASGEEGLRCDLRKPCPGMTLREDQFAVTY